ncbi:MAG: amino acid adenylation domain-containing protein, partial [Myxococcaceae bacterium]
PLSFAQQRLWLLEQLQPGGSAYNIPSALRLDGALNVGALEQAFTELVRRHEALRTTLHEEGGTPVQHIHPPTAFRLPVVDLAVHKAPEAEARRLALEEAGTPFDLARGPLLRASLLRLSVQQHVLLLNLHHVISDGWSSEVLVREVVALYEAFRQGRPSPLPELPVQYADYAVWQRSWLQGDALERQVAWWKQQLLGAPHTLELPTDFPRPPVQSMRGGSVHFRLPVSVSQALESLGQQEGATLFMVLLASTQALLARYSGQDDVVIGTPIAGRRFAELEGLIGFFVNTLALRARLDDAPTFRQLLARAKETTLGAQAHQDVPFEKLVEELQTRRDLSRTPLFQAMLVVQNTPASSPATAQGALSLHPVEVGGHAAKFDLTFAFATSPEGLRGSITYGADLFREETIQRLVKHLQVLIESAVATPDTRVAELPMLTADERHTLLHGWNETREELPQDLTFPVAFEQQVARTPQAPAVQFEDTVLSFAQLNAQANQLARHLRTLGVSPEVRVVLCFERSVDMLIALLAVFKAGGAYVPLDPTWPDQRRAFALQDCAATVVLTQQHLSTSWLPEGVSVVRVDAKDAPWATLPQHDLEPSATSENLAYVIYTSGSTGTPKGAMIRYGAMLNLQRALRRTVYQGVPTGMRLSVNAPLTFDASVQQLIHLIDGHCMCIVPEATRQDAEALVAWQRKYRVDAMDSTPSLLRLLLQAGLLEGAGAPTLLAPGGEAIDEATWNVLAASETTRTFNCYGPTECTVETTVCEIRPGTKPSLGGPLPNTRTYVLDANLHPVPVGVAGELFIAGAGLARGYLGRPHLTAERFVPNPFGSEPGERMYRTGDKARWTQDGTLEYLGRIDFQVKLRGFRIELGEIEVALQGHPDIQDATVLVREDVPGDQRLVAYVVSDAALEPNALRAFLKQRLPDYMVPFVYVPLATLPLATSGKVDRKALPAPEAALFAGNYEAPRGHLEQELASIWEDLLGIKPIGIKSHFFELGGHSLLAVRLMSVIRERLKRQLPLAALFQAPTVEQLAELLHQVPAPFSPLVPIRREGTRRPFFCVHPVGGNVLSYAELARALGPDQPFYG